MSATALALAMLASLAASELTYSPEDQQEIIDFHHALFKPKFLR